MNTRPTKLMLLALLEIALLESGHHPSKPKAPGGPTADQLRAAPATLRGLVGRKLVVRRTDGRYQITGSGEMVANAFVSGLGMGRGSERLDPVNYLNGDEKLHSEVMAGKLGE